MNVGMIFSKVASVAKNIGGNALLVGKKYTPEILIGLGITGFGVTVYETVQATNKTNDILIDKERRMVICQKNLADEEMTEYTLDDYERDIAQLNKESKWAIVRAWVPVGTMGTASVISILGGYRVLNGRYVATAAAYKALEASYDRYRGNVRDEYGDDVDYKMANNLKAEELEAMKREREDDAKRKGKKKGKYTTRYQREASTAVFDKYSEHWRDYWTPDQVWDYLKLVENQMNDILNIRRHVFLNEVLDRLGLPRTKEGQVLGWIKTRGSSPRISFGLDEMPEEAVRDFLSIGYNEDIWIRLRFNTMGMILDMLDKTPDILLN